MILARRADLIVTYSGVNISKDVSTDLTAFTFTDNESDKADDITITLQDRDGKWSDEWYPVLGDKIQARIEYLSNGKRFSLNCGTFSLDQFDSKGGSSGTTVSFKAQALPQNTSVKHTLKNRAWESVRLSEIAADVANSGKLKLTFASKYDPLFDRKTQNNQSDIRFLTNLCNEVALSVKVTNDQLVIFDREVVEQNAPVKDIVYGLSDVKDWSFSTQMHDTASKSTVEYKDPKTGKLKKATASDGSQKTSREIKHTQRVETEAQAQKIAASKLKNKNRKKTTGTIVLTGDSRYVAGATITISGFGKWDGKYYIDSATHNISGGYTTSLSLASILNPKKEEKPKKEKKQTKRKAKRKRRTRKKKEDTKTGVKNDGTK